MNNCPSLILKRLRFNGRKQGQSFPYAYTCKMHQRVLRPAKQYVRISNYALISEIFLICMHIISRSKFTYEGAFMQNVPYSGYTGQQNNMYMYMYMYVYSLANTCMWL